MSAHTPPSLYTDFSRSKGIASLTVSTPTSASAEWIGLPNRAAAKPSRWASPEFRLHEVVALAGTLWLVQIAVSLGSSLHPSFDLYSHKLSPGWIPGRLVDVSDPQYSSFRSNIPSLALLTGAFFLVRLLPLSRQSFLSLFAVASIVVMHGTSALKILFILAGNFALSQRFAGTRWGLLSTWIFNGVVFIAQDLSGGWKFAGLGLSSMDAYSGLMPRWHVSFNITALRLISFSIDHHWAVVASRANDAADMELNGSHASSSGPPTERQRASTAHHLSAYESPLNYLPYVLYSPLYIAGPIVTFNNFYSQIINPPLVPWRSVFSYGLRFLFSLLTMEVVLHWIYVVALKDVKAYRGLGPGELAVVGFWNLIIVWLKLLIPWRFFRLWALVDGIDPPENMVRCMANNYSCSGFWKSWHRSYNLWIVRYIYIPLGGAKKPVVSTVVVFTFVALWHDLSFTLLTWGWIVSLVVLPEVLAARVFPSSRFGERWWYRPLCGLGGVMNVLGMTSANLVGFVIGLQGMKDLLTGIWGSWHGVAFALLGCAGIYSVVQLQMEYREEERRRGIWRKY